MSKNNSTRNLLLKLFGGVAILAIALVALVWWLNQKPELTEVPEGFVEVDDGRFAWKAVSPDGSVIAVRVRPNEGEGDLSFWTEVFELELVDGKGYRLAETREVSSTDGVDGKLLLFEFAQSDVPFHYGLSVFVTDKLIVTLETAAELEDLERYEDAFATARASLNVEAAAKY